jgi:hypothetical protein
MGFGFFERLRGRTRDSILEGAGEAGRALEQGTDTVAEQTAAV